MNNLDFETINIVLPAAGVAKVTHRTRAANKQIKGVCLVSHSGDAALTGTKMKLLIDKKELFPSDFDPSILAFSQSVRASERFYDYIDTPISQSDIDIEFTDKSGGAGGTFTLIIKCQQDA